MVSSALPHHVGVTGYQQVMPSGNLADMPYTCGNGSLGHRLWLSSQLSSLTLPPPVPDQTQAHPPGFQLARPGTRRKGKERYGRALPGRVGYGEGQLRRLA